MPATFIAIVLAAYFLLLRYEDAEKQLSDRGHPLIRLLTPAAEYGVFSGNREELQQLAAALSRKASCACWRNGNWRPMKCSSSATAAPTCAAARAAGLRVAIIRGGECSEADSADDPPDFMISRLDELAGLVAGVRA